MHTSKRLNRETSFGKLLTTSLIWAASSFSTLLVLGALATPPALMAQQAATGTVSGIVIDNASGKYLEGAEIALEGTSLRVSTERGGSFSLNNVPAGMQKVIVSYPGMDVHSQAIEVKAGLTNDLIVRLASETIMLEAINISTSKEGMAQAQALQKLSVQTKIVAANDQFGEISEGNIGEYLKFLPGIGIDYNSNDARGISLRGLRTQFTIVAVDGTPMASAASGGDNRRFELEQIASNNVENYEIYKTVSPDLPADATGGFINMVTKSAFDRQDTSLLTYNFSLNVPSSRVETSRVRGAWGKSARYTIRPNVEMNYARRLSDKVGINFNYRWSEIYHDSPRNEYTWLFTGPAANGGIYSVEDPSMLTFLRNNEQKMTHREAFATKVDYKISDKTKLVAGFQWNWYDLLFAQRSQLYGFTGTVSSSSRVTTVPVNLPGADMSQSGPGSYIRNQFNQRAKYGTTLHGTTTLTHEFDYTSKIWVSGYWSKANSKYRDHTKGFVGAAVAQYTGTQPFMVVSDATTRTAKPNLAFSVPEINLRDLSNYTLSGNNSDNLRARPDTAWDTKAGLQANYSKEYDQLRMPLKLQVGIAHDTVQRDIRRKNIRGLGISALSGGALKAYKEDMEFDAGYDYGIFDTLDIYRLYQDNAAKFTTVSTDDMRDITESNDAAYLRFDVKLSRDWLLFGGVRYEEHEIDAKAQSKANARSKPSTSNIEYSAPYTSVSLKYNPVAHKNWVMRLGFSETIGHPDYADVLPNFIGESASGVGDGTITVPDKGLKPYNVKNFDFSLEYYLKKNGVLSLWLFRKQVEGFIISQTLAKNSPEVLAVVEDYGLNPAEYTSGTLRKNGQGSALNGLELMYNQSLSFLPKPFNGLSFQANYTKISIGADDLATKYAQLLSAVTESSNFVLGYRYQKFNATVSANYTNKVHIGTSAQTNGTSTATLATWKAPETKVNIKVEYSLSRHARVYAELRNLGYNRTEYFTGYEPELQHIKLPGREFEYGDPIIVVGFKGEF